METFPQKKLAYFLFYCGKLRAFKLVHKNISDRCVDLYQVTNAMSALPTVTVVQESLKVNIYLDESGLSPNKNRHERNSAEYYCFSKVSQLI